MNNLAAQPGESERARQTIESFVRRFQPSYGKLACYAALPLVLTPELLSYLRNRFLRGEVPWVAEADLLLSELCAPVGYDLFAMDTAVRAVLLEEMRATEGLAQMQQVARLLIQYVRHLSRTNPLLNRHELQAQQWAAMVYLDNHRNTAVREIAEALKNCAVNETARAGVAETLVNQSEMARLARLVQDLSPQLGTYPELVSYAETMSRLLADSTGAEAQRLHREQRLHARTIVLDNALPTPGLFVEPRWQQTIEASALGPIKHRYALVVGVNAYADATAKLQFCVNDAKALEQMLTEYGYTVVCMHDEVDNPELLPTTLNVATALGDLCERAGPDALLMFYFTGHGAVVNGQLMLLTKDAHAGSLEREALRASELEMRLMRQSRARCSMMVLDTMNAATNLQRPSLEAMSTTLTTFAPNFVYIAPSYSEERWELKHGVFTYHVLQGLDGAADFDGNGAIMVNELLEHLSRASAQLKEGSTDRLYELLVRVEGNANQIILADARDRKSAATPVTTALEEPVLDPARFFDREEILDKIFEVLRENRLNVALVGEAGIGKSTIMEMVRLLGPARLGLPPEAFVQLSSSAFRDIEEFYEALSDTLGTQLYPGGDLSQTLGNKRYIICLEGMEERLVASAADTLGILIEITYRSESPLKIVTASRRSLVSLTFSEPTAFNSPLRGAFVEIQVPPFSEEVAVAFFRQGMADTGAFFSDAGDIEEFVNNLGRHPGRLQADLDELHSSYRKQQEQRHKAVKAESVFPIANPYVVGSPVSGSQFVDRVEVISRLREYIKQEQNSPPVLLYGQRRIGKTSILQNLEKYLDPTELLVHLDMSWQAARANVSELLAGLTTRIYREWSRRYPHSAPRLREYDEVNLSEYFDQPYGAFDRFLQRLDQERELDQTQHNLRIIIALDEFSVTESAMDESLVESLLAHWQAMLKKYSWLRVILAAEHPSMNISDSPPTPIP